MVSSSRGPAYEVLTQDLLGAIQVAKAREEDKSFRDLSGFSVENILL